MHNSLDSTFCKKCGAAVSEEDVLEARAKLSALIAEGNHAFNEGRTDEALAISESVLQADPESTTALWLKAICHERHGDVAMALDCAEKIVELNPDSDLDKIRRNQLRSKLTASVSVYERPDKRLATLGAVAAGVLVICMGVLAANIVAGRTPTETVAYNDAAPNLIDPQNSSNQTGQPENSTRTGAGQSQAGNPDPSQSQTQPPTDPALTNSPGMGDVPAEGSRPKPNLNTNTSNPQPSNYSGSTLPIAEENQPEPIRIDPNDIRPINSGGKPDPQPTEPKRGGDSDPETFAANAQQDQGTIDINVYNDNKTSKPTTASMSNTNGLEALTRTAYQAYQLGNYQQAANLFQQALRNGGNPVSLNQRLGQSYERMGQVGDAVDAYRRAVQAGQAALAQGKANPAGIQTVIDSCQQALKKLGG
jgi:tetratricopeptide (TPR) repeat protein